MCKKTAPRRRKKLLDALESRLDTLTENLAVAQVADKGIDMVKEIKELHAILRAMQDGDTAADAAKAGPPRVILVWGAAPEGEAGQSADS